MSSSSAPPRIRAPISGCLRIWACSSSVSGPGLRRIASGTPILPMSWRTPATRTRSTCSRRQPELARHQLAVAPDGLRVARGAGVAHVERLGEVEHGDEVGVAAVRGLVVADRQDALDLGAVEDGAVAAEGLGRVERLVRGSQQRVGGGAMSRVGGDAEAQRERDRLRRTRRANRLRSRSATMNASCWSVSGSTSGELLAAHPRGHVDAALVAPRAVCRSPASASSPA